MIQIPQDRSPESTLELIHEGYEFIGNRCRRLNTDIFQARLALQNTICMRGEEAARLFYDNERFEREGAAPKISQKTLFGEGGVQGMDGEAHRHRKQMFLSLMTPEGIQRLVDLAADQWDAYLDRWEGREEVELFYASSELLCRAVCDWTGVPLPEFEVEQRTNEMLAMIDGPATLGPRYLRGRRGRRRAERWVGALIEWVRSGAWDLEEGSALRTVALHRDLDGNLLDNHVASVELINVLRPTVAVGRWITFSALALHDFPEERARLRGAGDEEVERFVQEVRRFYPFFPFVGAIVKHDFQWKGYHFPEGTRVLLDLYGTDHHPALWEDPDDFRPDRFREWDGSAYNFIPQGGGDHHVHHRCPGEWIAIALMKQAVRRLVDGMEYDVPGQDLAVDLSRMPAIPKSRFLIRNVRRRA